MAEVVEYLSQKVVDGKPVLDDEKIVKINAYYAQYGAK